MVVSPLASSLMCAWTFLHWYVRCPAITFFTQGIVGSIGIVSLLDPSVLCGADASFASGEVKHGRGGGVWKVGVPASRACFLVFEERLDSVCAGEAVVSAGSAKGSPLLFSWGGCTGLNDMVGEHTITVESAGLRCS